MFGFPFMRYAEHHLKCWKKYLGLYFACGTVALIVQTILMHFSSFEGIGCIGSSGAIFGIVAYALAAADHNRYIRISAHCILAYHLYTQGIMAYYSLTFPFGVGFGAHLGGILCGISVVWVPRIRRLIKRLISR
jgi:membrane associated rhomboid family serine protease